MQVKITPSAIHGSVTAPAGKSSMQRACAAALLRNGSTKIINPGKSNDDQAAIDVIQKLGASIIDNPDGSLTITSKGVQPISEEINCGESGLGIRMFTPIAALSSHPITITGTGSLLTRPMHFFDEIFPTLGIQIQSKDGKLPLSIHGPLQPNKITVDGSLSSQFLTGLLMAYGSAAKTPATITVTNLKSKPYIDLTLQVMQDFGMNVPVHQNYETFTFNPVKNILSSDGSYIVEGDWSGAAFLLVAGAIAGCIHVGGLDVNSTQADKAVLLALSACGCDLMIRPDKITIGPAELKAFTFDATDCPDLFPPLVALAAYCKGTSNIFGVSRLAHKESDRAITLQMEFRKMGVEIELKGDQMLVKGGDGLHGAAVHSHHDHRIAMACAVAALRAEGDVTIDDAEAINKSYPDFYDHLRSLKAEVV